MSNQQNTSILFPPGRVVQGDLYEPQTKDNQGNPLTIKTGPNAGQPRVNYYFAVAIPKAPGQSAWWQTPWGEQIYRWTMGWWPHFFDQRTGACINNRFAWKIEDGDDATPNTVGRRNCDREGFPGHWVVGLSSSFAPKIFDAQGQPLLQPGLVKRGYWVEVYGMVASNENTQNPGIYINHSMVAYRGPDKEIISGPDPRSVGFGQASLPPGVSAAPAGNVANFPATAPTGAPPMPGAAAPTGAPPMPGATAPTGAPPMPGATPTSAPPMPGASAPPMPGASAPPMPGASAPPVTVVTPQASFLQPPGAPTAPIATAAPTVVCPLGAPQGYKMVKPGITYQQFRANNWSDAQMLQAGHMVRL